MAPARSPEASRLADPTAPATPARAAPVVAWALVFWGGVQLAARVFERNAMTASLVQAALAEWGAGRMGVAWSDPLSPPASPASMGKRAAIGAGMGCAAAVVAIGAAAATGGAAFAPASPDAVAIVLGLVPAALAAVRDELLLRGGVLRATRGLLPAWACLAICGAAAAAARFGVDGAFSMAVLGDGLRAVALAALWVHDRGAWMAWGANTAWAWTFGGLAHGAADVRFAFEPQALGAVLAVLGAAAAAGVASIGRRSSAAGLR
ncbi:MAG TPA: hypothetical protein VGM06_17415 [Polyangiaceae bacterium]|jgi:hypothetical protein